MWRKITHFFSGNYTILLLLLFTLFITRPYAYGILYTEIWKTVLTISLVVAIFNCAHQQIVKRVIFVLAFPVLIISWLNIFYPTSLVYILTAGITSVYMLICAGSIIFDVLLKARVTLETLRGVICAYFLIAFIFAYVYIFIEFVIPGSFVIRGKTMSLFVHPHYFSEMLYFSFITLLTIGYGDIVAVNEFGQTAAVLEGIVGQLYIAILVARIVAVYSLISDKRLLKEVEKKIHSD